MSVLLTTHDPRAGLPAVSYPCATPEQVAQICRRARDAFFNQWRAVPSTERATALLSVAALLRDRLEEFAAAEARDTGKPLDVARGEVAGAAGLWEYAAALARTEHSECLSTATTQGLALTLREPMGVVGLIVPWNYPLITAAERMPFALAAGCCVVLKPSELAVGSLALLVEAMANNLLFPPGVVQVLFGLGDAVGRALVANPDVDMIAFVGSTATGRAIESAATATGKRVSAELGGNNHVLIYPDADLPRAARAVVAGGFRNGGQACIAGTHVLVDPSVADEWAVHLEQALRERFPVGEAGTAASIQPMISAAHKQRLLDLIEQARPAGFVPLPGSLLDGQGNFLGPVVLDRVPLHSPLRQQEIFGPVVTVTRVEADKFPAILADNQYGLAVYVWTAATSAALAAIRQVRIGRIWVNADPEFWLPELPVGGFAASGVGREGGAKALDTYSLPKSVLIF
ncbi:aldehyde dehydrogenase [Pseudogulbenkiania sp. NH8B]|uniref:aldehyde dehydrogenase family protein n=1 Tax=Pseudogulbenkiania sp. (strain NH8B) TaxID=748280 RepID=UPI0002279457|nr:aldehyde dehydrogenase family protein [Pseudogulbenkiania sp. NH8B]BAK75316.1 aldehyde dehydrogenase [Pseudogulbenkiania sp. NH8B]